MFGKPWPSEVSVEELVEGTQEASVTGLVRLDEVRAMRDARGLDRALTRDWLALHAPMLEERFGHGDHIAAFVRCEVRSVSALRIDCTWLGDAGMAEVLAAPWLSGLEELELAIAQESVQGFAGLSAIRGLRRFALSKPDAQDDPAWVGDDLAALLADAAWVELASLSLPRTRLGARGLKRLLDGALPALAHLDVDGTVIGEAGYRALAEAPGLSRLVSLGLRASSDAEDASEALTALLASPRLAVRRLDLADVIDAARSVADSPRMGALDTLRLSELDEDQLDALVGSRLPALRHLELESGDVSSGEALGRSTLLGGLESLCLGNLGEASHEGLFERSLPNLVDLSLEVGRSTADALERAQLPSLKELHLDLTWAEDDEARIVACVKRMPKLERVVVSLASSAAIESLTARFGSGVRVRELHERRRGFV